MGYRRLFPVIDEKSVQLALQGQFVDVPTPGGIGKPELLFWQGRGGMAVWGSFGVASEIEELGHARMAAETAQTANAPGSRGAGSTSSVFLVSVGEPALRQYAR